MAVIQSVRWTHTLYNGSTDKTPKIVSLLWLTQGCASGPIELTPLHRFLEKNQLTGAVPVEVISLPWYAYPQSGWRFIFLTITQRCRYWLQLSHTHWRYSRELEVKSLFLRMDTSLFSRKKAHNTVKKTRSRHPENLKWWRIIIIHLQTDKEIPIQVFSWI